MPRAWSPCSTPGCPTPTPPGVSKCAPCRSEAERKRGTRQARGYDATHDTLRAHWLPLVAGGGVTCWRCGELIHPSEPWDLGHDDVDRTRYRGPEHANRCNRSAGGKAAHQQ